MVRVGEVYWVARVEGQGKASAAAQDLQEDMEGVGESAGKAAAAQNDYSEKVGEGNEKTESASRLTGALDVAQSLLASTVFFAGKQIGIAGAATRAYAAAMSAATVASTAYTASVAGLAAVKAGLLAGIGKIIALGSGFISWLAAGSAGALAAGAAIGAFIGLLGVFALEMTGVLDLVGRFANWLGNKLPAWAVDGIIILVSSTVGWLAVLGGAIVGFVRGYLEGGLMAGLRGAVDGSEEILNIFLGSWRRTFARIKTVASDSWAAIKRSASNILSDLGDTVGGYAKSGWNAVVPDKLELPSTTLSAPEWAGGHSYTIGGQSLDLPQLQVGGKIQESGAAVVHRGEAVIPRPMVEAAERGSGKGGGGSGGGDTTVEQNISVDIGDQSLDLRNLSRGDLRELADLIADRLGENTGDIAGA